jgi:hypothetical protein
MDLKTKILMKITDNKSLAIFAALVVVAVVASWL